MTSKAKEVNVDDLLNNFDDAPKTNKDTKKTKVDNDWAEEEESNFTWGAGDNKGASKAKTTKKKTQAKGWGDIEEETKPQQQAPSADLAKIQDDQKKKIFKKPTGDTKPKNVVIEDEYFPSIGEKPVDMPKKKPEPTPAPTTTVTDTKQTTQGPRKFVNAKKTDKGEHFVPLDANLVEKIPEKVEKLEKVEKVEKIEKIEKIEKTEKTENGVEAAPPRRVPEGFFKRNTQDQTQETTPPSDSKFKFGGEGPIKFSGSKISFKREEEKSEQEQLRLQKEREIEERLAREREEEAKKREQREQHKKPFNKDEQKPEKNESGEGKGPIKFTKSKKEGDKNTTAPRKISNEKPVAPVEKPEETAESTQAVEKIEVLGNLSTKSWGDGAILKKTVKK
jgi:translation initiation factor IF-2